MPSPFPGMDPYLEHPDLWPDVHNALIAALRDDLSPVLRPRYYVALEERTYLEEPPELLLVGRPDLALVSVGREGTGAEEHAAGPQVVEVEIPMAVPVRETYLEVRGVAEGDVVTVIELLSPANKRPGAGRRLYLEKRTLVVSTGTSLVEIDLLRAGDRMPMVGPPVPSDYSILVSRAWRRPKAQQVGFRLRDPIPGVRVPLRSGEEEPTVRLGDVLAGLYDRASYDLRIDYRRAPVPPLSAEDTQWATRFLAAGSLTSSPGAGPSPHESD